MSVVNKYYIFLNICTVYLLELAATENLWKYLCSYKPKDYMCIYNKYAFADILYI